MGSNGKGNKKMNELNTIVASPIQDAIWKQKLSPLGKWSSAYIAVTTNERLCPDIIADSLKQCLSENSVLRYEYRIGAGEVLLAEATDEPSVDISYEDWSDLSGQEQVRKKQQILACVQQRTWSSAGARVTLATLGADQTWLLLEVPSVNVDSHTLVLLLGVLFGKNNFNNSIDYADVASWLNEFQTRSDLRNARLSWSSEALRVAVNQPLGLRRYAMAAESGIHYEKRDITDLVSSLAAHIKITHTEVDSVEDFICAGLRKTLHRFSEGAVLARTITSRSGELLNVAGPLARAVIYAVDSSALLADIAANETHTRNVQGKFVECFSKQEYASDSMQFLFEEIDAGIDNTYELDLIDTAHEHYKLCFSLVRQGNRWDLHIKYDIGYIEPAAVALFVDAWYSEIVDTLDGTHGDLRSPAIPSGLVKTEARDLFMSLILGLQNSDAQVVGYRNGEREILDFPTLDRESNKVANALIDSGIGSGDVVALYLPRGINFVVALLGTVKAGAAYLPLDLANPDARNKQILELCQPAAILHEETLQLVDGMAINIDKVRKQGNASAPGRAFGGEDTVYILFTSGSTGQPKGVQISMAALANHMDWMLDAFALSSADCFLHRTSTGFDASVWEIWAPLLLGANLVITPEEAKNNPAILRDILQENSVTVLQAIPSLAEFYLDADVFSGINTIKYFYLGGEALKTETARRLHQQLGCEVINLYGPTECCIQVSSHHYSDDLTTTYVPIGGPINNTRFLVVDNNGRSLGPGETGELLVAGDCLFQGYYAQPELTCQVTTTIGGRTYYCTGDIVLALHDGILHYVERKDDQIKYNGNRLELQEVANFLVEQKYTASAHGIFEKKSGKIHLFIIDPVVAIKDIQQLITNSFPEYMLPTGIHSVAEFPRLSNGKVNRAELSRMLDEQVQYARFAQPQTAVEAELFDIWKVLLGTDSFGIDSDFYSAGGDSLLAMRLANRIAAAFSIDVKMRDLFKYKTIRSFAHHIQSQQQLVNTAKLEDFKNNHDALSYSQKRMWFINEFEGLNAIYNVPATFRLVGDLDVAIVNESIDKMIARHQILRTNIISEKGEPRALVHASRSLDICYQDFSALPLIAREERVRQLQQQEAAYHFDLANDLLLRLVLIKTGANEHVMIMTMHHVISDGWSNDIVIRELTEIYNARMDGVDDGLAELDIQYANYAAWQIHRMESQSHKEQLVFWTDYLDSAPLLHSLPLDRPRAKTQSFNGATLTTPVPQTLDAGIDHFCKNYGVTVFTLLQGLLAVLVSRYSNVDDVVMGTPTAGRNDVNLEKLIGCFINTIVLRNSVGHDQTFTEFLASAETNIKLAQENQDVPFDAIIEELDLGARSMSANPVFQIMIVQENSYSNSLQLKGVASSWVETENNYTKFDLILGIYRTADNFSLSWTYNSDLFERATIEQFAKSYHILLDAVLQNPDTVIANLPLQDARTLEQQDRAWNNTVAGFDYNYRLEALISAQVARVGQRPAVSDGRQCLSYRQLDELANRLANCLVDKGVAPGAVVGLCMERCAASVVALLAILKAGAVYMPLDCSRKPRHLQQLFEQSQATLIICDRDLGIDVPVIDLSDVSTLLAWPSVYQNLALDTAAPACLVYTSGSTGKPKGVLLSHRGLVNRIKWLSSVLPCADDDVIGQKTSLTFVDHIAEILQPLSEGACCEVIGDEEMKDLDRLTERLAASAVTRLTLVPGLLKALLPHKNFDNAVANLRCLVSSGEPLTAELASTVAKRIPHTRIFNFYGSTEVSADALWMEYSEQSCGSESVAIGRPIANMRAYIVDSEGQLVPPGVCGELCLSGPGLALSYTDPAENKAHFCSYPAIENGARIYRTGDRCFREYSGDIHYLGRSDSQIKVRGMRMEAAEIEHAVHHLPGVQEAVAGCYDGHLVVWLVAHIPSGQKSGDWLKVQRKQLKETLADHMIPDTWVLLERLPLTRTGKVDRQSLPAPAHSDYLRSTYVAPRSKRELELCQLWQETLNLPQVGIEDNFFLIGGHSLLATRLLSRVREHFHQQLPLKLLFAHPTIAELALHLESEFSQIPIPAMQRVEPSAKYELSYAQERLWFLNQLGTNGSEYNLPMRFHVVGELNTDALQHALDVIVSRHEILRSVIGEENGKRFQQVRPTQAVTFRHHDLRKLTSTQQVLDVGNITRKDAQSAFDLRNDVLVRAHAFTLTDNEHVIYINLHHIAADGWSLGIFYREFNQLYDAYCHGEMLQLPELNYQYKDFAHWQRNWLKGDALDKHVNYWREALDGLPMVHSLPLDKARPPRLRQQGKVIGQRLNSQTLKDIHSYCQRHGVTLFMFLHSAFSVLFSRYSREQDIVLGTPVAGRSQVDVDSMIGHFVNTLVLRAHIDGRLGFNEIVRQNREQVLAAFEHQHVPFELLVDKLNPVRSLSHSPLFQIMLTLQNNKQHDIALKGLEQQGGIETLSAAKFDLEMVVEEYNNQLFIDWVYNLDLFEAGTIERMARSFDTLVAAVLVEKNQPVAQLPIVSDEELHLILDKWNETAVTYSEVARLETLFRKKAQVTPEKISLISGDTSYTFQQVDLYSDQLCHRLLESGVKQHERVGVYMARSVDAVIAILAILKAGAAYVVLDPDYPQARLQFIINDSAIQTLVTASPLVGQGFDGVTSITVGDVIGSASLAAKHYTPVVMEDINSPACVIYTSGSTGEPKGVVLSHAGFVNRICWMRNTFPAMEHEFYCHKTSLNFVDHVAEIFQPLVEGVSNLIISENDVKDVEPLLEQLHKHKVTRITLVPSFLKTLLDYKSFRDLKELQFIISSGEILADNLADKVLEQLPQVRLLNLYGSTEVSADASYHLTSSHECDEVMQYFKLKDEFTYRDDENQTYRIPLAFDNCYTTPDTSYETVRNNFTDYKMPDTPAKMGQYIESLNRDVIPFTVNVSSSQYIGHMTSLLPSFMIEFSGLVTALNQNLVKMETSKSLTFLERQAIAMVHREFFNLPACVYEEQTQAVNANFGLVVSGGTSANITALISARNKGLFKFGYSASDLREKGASKLIRAAGMEDAVIICSKLAHYSIKKAANILGIGEQNIIVLAQDESQRACIADLNSKLDYCNKNHLFVIAVVGIAGATETGTIDPLPAMAKLAAQYQVHFHVDAAWGGTFRFANVYKHMLKGIESADSVTFCAHKQLYLPQGISICLFKDPLDNGLLSTHARYQAQAGSYDTGQYTVEGSRPANALFLHAALHLLSRQGYSWLLERGMENTSYFKRLIENSEAFELIGKPDMNIINYRYIPEALRGKKYKKFTDEENEIINGAVDTIQWKQFLDGKTFVSKTSLNLKSVSDNAIRVFRVVLSNPVISKQDLKAVLLNQLEIAAHTVEDHDYDLAAATGVVRNFTGKNETESVLIGKPIGNMKILLLDDAKQLVPVGVKGDVYVAGPGLALGYQHQQQFNSERFVINPWCKQQTVIFKTGDVARWLDNGELQYVGRADNCVKIRGAMVDLAEIELLISQVSGVREAALVATNVIGSDLQIVAYVADQSLTDEREIAQQIRSRLREKIPAYMIPEYFVSMASLPRTPNGKINRKLLPAFSIDQSLRREYVAPATELEKQISDMWIKILKINKIGIRDCFFEIGGHSLLAMTMLNRLKEKYGIKVSLKDIFEYSTIEDLAGLLSAFSIGDEASHDSEPRGQDGDDIELII